MDIERVGIWGHSGGGRYLGVRGVALLDGLEVGLVDVAFGGHFSIPILFGLIPRGLPGSAALGHDEEAVREEDFELV